MSVAMCACYTTIILRLLFFDHAARPVANCLLLLLSLTTSLPYTPLPPFLPSILPLPPPLHWSVQEFLCAINGHVMKDPVRVRSSGLVFEAATIELWLRTRGAVCPITGQNLDRTELETDDDLRNRIKRYHIQQTTRRAVSSSDGEDDLYDF